MPWFDNTFYEEGIDCQEGLAFKKIISKAVKKTFPTLDVNIAR